MSRLLHRSGAIPPAAVGGEGVRPRLSDRRRGDHVIIAPPYIATGDHIPEIVDSLGWGIDAALDGARRG